MNVESGDASPDYVAYMVHPDTFPKANVYVDVKSNEVEGDVKSSDVDVDVKPINIEVDVKPVIAEDDTRSRKRVCPFKVCGYRKENNTWKFNLVSSIHINYSCHKLAGQSIVCLLNLEEKELVYDMIFNMVSPKHILEMLKHKRPQNVSNIKKMYKAIRGPRTKMQQLLKLLDDEEYVSRLPLLEIVGVTSAKMTLLGGFAFLKSKKEDNVTRSLEGCKTMLKDQEKYAKGHYNRLRYNIDEFGCKDVFYILCITL
ncbi:uncharacterized protein LOC131639675 [Vicia villosa]|uniref:uncharacterized protein LOC131639675 n=1 Tax=Vicia villosa TaxID=3911 RepID=UPI00273CDB56|nr:uncharacterized protein LOC131639675 [Vicia villosa]